MSDYHSQGLRRCAALFYDTFCGEFQLAEKLLTMFFNFETSEKTGYLPANATVPVYKHVQNINNNSKYFCIRGEASK